MEYGFAVIRDDRIIGYLKDYEAGVSVVKNHDNMTVFSDPRDQGYKDLLLKAISIDDERFDGCWMLQCIKPKTSGSQGE